MAKKTIRNIGKSPYVLNAVPPVTVQPGEEVEVEISDGEVAAFKTFGVFELAKPAKAEKPAAE